MYWMLNITHKNIIFEKCVEYLRNMIDKVHLRGI